MVGRIVWRLARYARYWSRSCGSIPLARISGGVMIVNCMSDENDLKRRPVDVVEPKDYGHGFQLKQAASQSVDSSLKMLSSAVQALSTGYAEYSSLLQRGILLLGVAADIESARLGGVGSGFEDEMVACRCEVASLRSRIGDMVFLYEEVKKLAESAAGVAFLTGNELASSLASSHLYHVHIEVQQMKNVVEKLEQEYADRQQQLIRNTKT